MILHRLRVRRFLGLRDATFTFAPGVNVVIGPNESGKSTLRSAIFAVLYANPATTSTKFRDEIRSWGAGDPPDLVLEFTVDGKPYTLVKDFAGRKILLKDDLGRTWEQHKAVQERIAAQLGLADERLFEATALVVQAELERVHYEKSIAAQLGRIVGGGGEDVTAAIRRLEQHIRSMEKGLKGLTKEPGMLKALDAHLAALRDEHARLSAGAAAAERARVELVAVRSEIARVEADLEVKRALADANREILTLEERVGHLQREERMLEGRVKNIGDHLGQLTALDRDLEAATAAGLPGEQLTAAARKLTERMAVFEMEAGRLRQELAHPPEHLDDPAWRRWILFGGGLALAIAGGVLGLAGRVVPGAVLAGAGVVAFVAALWLQRRLADERVRASVRQQERERRLEQLSRDLTTGRASLADYMAKLGCASVAEAEQKLQRHRDLANRRAQVAKFLDDLRSGNADEEITERWNTVRRDVFNLQEHLRSPEITAKRLTPLQIASLEREVQQLARTLGQLQDRDRRLAVQVERHSVDAETLATVEERIPETEERLRLARHRHAVCQEALAGLVEANKRAQVRLREVMEQQAGDYLHAISGGRYRRLQVDEETLELSAWSDDAGAWVPAAEPQLSRGTVDLVYLAARLALVRVLTDKRPPLLFDDPFITFDEGRREAAAALLRELAREHQVFLFTYTHHFDGVADNLIELTAPSREAVSVEPATSDADATIPSVGPLWDQPR